MRFTLTVSINPGDLRVNSAWRVGKDRRGKAVIYKSRLYKNARAIVGEAAMLRMVGLLPLSGPLVLSLREFWPRQHREGAAVGLALGDVDGPLKGVLDALEEGGVFADDAQIVRLKDVEKFIDAKNPRIEVSVREL